MATYDPMTTARKPKYRLEDYRIALRTMQHESRNGKMFSGGFCKYLSLEYSNDRSLRRYPEIWKNKPAEEKMHYNKPAINAPPERVFWFKPKAEGTKRRIRILKRAIFELEIKLENK
jgi:hypothetical protein